MQFQVPQFIETEDKIVGPLTLKQFGYVGGAALIVLLLFFVLDLFLWILIAGIFGTIGAMLAFGKMNGRPLIIFVSNFLEGIWRPKVYVFRPSEPRRTRAERAVPVVEPKVKLAPQATPTGGLPATAKKAPLFGGISGLRNWIATSKTAIPRREKPLPRDFGKPQKTFKEDYEVVRHLTGERELAKRVDYR